MSSVYFVTDADQCNTECIDSVSVYFTQWTDTLLSYTLKDIF